MVLTEINIEAIISLSIDRFVVFSNTNQVLEEVKLIKGIIYLWDAHKEVWTADIDDTEIENYMSYLTLNKIYIKQ
jgi:hypothetical protein